MSVRMPRRARAARAAPWRGLSTADFEALREDHDRLAEEVARLRALVERMAGELGIDAGSPEAGA